MPPILTPPFLWALTTAARPADDGGSGASTTAGGNALLPGAGAIVAFIATASGHQPEVAGKPHQAMADLVRARYGPLSMVVGDRPDTDGLFAVRIGAKFGLVLSGVTRPSDLPVEPSPALVGADLSALVKQALGRSVR